MKSILELIDELEWLYEKYSNEVRSATQPYHLQKVTASVKDYQYDPAAVLIRENLLEHIGALPMIATTIYPYIDDPEVDLGQALMLAVHDIGELATHDVNTFIKQESEDEAEQKNQRLALRLLMELSRPLHASVGTKQYSRDDPCDVCVNAARLAVQYLVPVMVDSSVSKIHHALDWSCPSPPTGPEY